jgi:hypothetical protein
MSINTDQLKIKIERARGDVYQIGINLPSPELKQALSEADRILHNFLEYEIPAIIKAEAQL